MGKALKFSTRWFSCEVLVVQFLVIEAQQIVDVCMHKWIADHVKKPQGHGLTGAEPSGCCCHQMGIDLGDTTQVSECSSQWIGSTRKSILKNRTTQLGHALTIKHEGFRRCSLHPGIQFSDSAYLQWVCFKIAIMTVWLSVFPHSQTKNAQCSLTTYISIYYIYIHI